MYALFEMYRQNTQTVDIDFDQTMRPPTWPWDDREFNYGHQLTPNDFIFRK